ncbi:hypothetical protein SAMN05444280_10421 [Tangfeifania diversioriginum]|uniref:Fibronectin type-III domain-containing protein n=1 Tax=Tangfeifania diversioriginum TaxID=1168035 RepID=A0A1M6CM46_9BACT|nr:fibronectin type III domain-containing protein [Tangfeifania diversioriginum]SHI61993.1 hypothetical protein SAMN05444280_10421 [Tangfeifania diversioriginum]
MRKSTIVIILSLTASLAYPQQPGWYVDKGYLNTMVVHAVVKHQDAVLDSEGSMLGAFKNGVCRGYTSIFDGPNNRQFQLSIGSDLATEDDIELKVYDKESNQTYNVESRIQFEKDVTLGTIESPLVYFTFANSPNLDFIEIGKYKFYGDKITEITNSEYTIKGNVQINNHLKIDSDITVKTDELTITGNGIIFLDNIPIFETVDIYDGIFELKLAEGLSFSKFTPENMGIKLSKLPVIVESIYLIEEGVLINGDLKLPKLFNTVDAEITTLEVTRQYGLRLIGTVSLKDIKIHSVKLDTLGLTFNTIDDYFSASAYLSTPFFGIGATSEIIGGKMNYVQINAALPYPIPFATTGFSISEINGGVDDLINPPITLLVGIDLVPTVQGNFEIVKLNDLSLSYTWGKEFYGSGSLQLFDKDMANVDLSIQRNKVAFGGDVSLFNVFNGSLVASIFKENNLILVNGNLWATLSIPALEGFPFDILSGLVGLPHVVAETDNYLINNIIAGNTKIRWFNLNYKAEWSDRKLSVDYGRGYENWNEILFGDENLLKLKNASLNRFEGQSLILNSRTVQKGLKSSSTKFEQVYSLQQNSPTMIIRFEQQGQMPDCSIKLPDGSVVSKSTVNNTNQFYTENETENKIFFQFDDPPTGEWTIIAENMNEDIFVDVIGAEMNSSLMLDSIEKSQNEIIIPYRGISKNNAQLSLYYDDDNIGFNGIKIDEINLEQEIDKYQWNTSKISNGAYFIYGVLDDNVNAPIKVYAPNSIRIESENAPSPPYDLNYILQNDTLKLQWKYSQNEDVNFNVYYSENDQFLNTTNSFNAGKKNHLLLSELISGKIYHFSVSAINENNVESKLSTSIKVTYHKKNQNNPPNINEVITPGFVYVDSIFLGQIYANDADGDQLIFYTYEAPENLKIDNYGVINWQPTKEDIGFHTFYVFVSDEHNTQDSAKITITVKDNIVSLPEIGINKSHFTSNCDLPVISLYDLMLNNNETAVDSVFIKIKSGKKSYQHLLYEESMHSQNFRGILKLKEIREKLNLNSVDTIMISYTNYDYATSDSVLISISNKFDDDLIDISGSFVLNSEEDLKVSAKDGFYSYTWFKDSMEVSTEREYYITSTGTYFVKIEDQYGCSAYSESITVTYTGTNSLDETNDFLIHFNQAIKQLTIENHSRYQNNAYVIISNSNGQILVQEEMLKFNYINLKKYSTGFYNISIFLKNRVLFQKSLIIVR